MCFVLIELVLPLEYLTGKCREPPGSWHLPVCVHPLQHASEKGS